MNNYIIIPARLSSQRLPGKLLLSNTGYPLIWHTIQRALEANFVDKIIVATENIEIYQIVMKFNISRVSVILTPIYSSGTERVLYVVQTLKNPNIIINLQGDEPELSGKYVDNLINILNNTDCVVATLAAPASFDEYNSNSVVKVVIDHNSNAMYFSRSGIPYGGNSLKHFGLYAYKLEFFSLLPQFPACTYKSELLEQLQWLQAGIKIHVIIDDNIKSIGIDVKEEYDNFVQRWLDNN